MDPLRHRAHPLILLAQWPSRAPHHQSDASFADRVFQCAEILFAADCDLSDPAHPGRDDCCAEALLSRAAQHLTMDETWGIHGVSSPEDLIMRASLSPSSPGRGLAAQAWIAAAERLATSGVANARQSSGLTHFMALARSLCDRATLRSHLANSIEAPASAGRSTRL